MEHQNRFNCEVHKRNDRGSLATVPPASGLVALMFGTRYMAMRQAHLNSITTRLLVWLLASCAPPAAVEIFEGSTPFAIR